MHQPDYGEGRDSARGYGSTMRMRDHAPHLPPNQEILLSRLTPADACTGESEEMASSESIESVGEFQTSLLRLGTPIIVLPD